MKNPDFRVRLLQWIINLVCEKMSNAVMNETHEELGFQIFQPYSSFNDPTFDQIKDFHIYDIIYSHQMHSEKHTSICFKYSTTEYRIWYSHYLMKIITMNLITDVIWLKRDHCWLNAYNSWLSLMIRVNHDIQILLMKDHVLMFIFYILKYICKLKETFHSKLTIVIIYCKIFIFISFINIVDDWCMILQIYNKIENHWEIGVPEAISHLLHYPDHYISMIFQSINITQLWFYIIEL